MSEFLKFAFEEISSIVYNIAAVFAALIKLLFTGWVDYILVFTTYFPTLGIFAKALSILLMLVLIAIPVLIIYLAVKKIKLRRDLKNDTVENDVLYKEIGKLNKQVLDLMDEKSKILNMKVSSMGGTGYAGGNAVIGNIRPDGGAVQTSAAASDGSGAVRFPKLSEVDFKYRNFTYPEYDDTVTLQQFADGYRSYAAGTLKLYYTPEVVRRFIAGLAASKLLILEGISGTGKTSLPHSFSRYLSNPATMVAVQPVFRDRTEIIGYFNEFSKKFNETEFLRALYEANYLPEPNYIVLDEMNLARIEYYFAEMLSILEMPSHEEWKLDLVPTAWQGDPVLLENGKIRIPENIWFVGTANNDDSTFTITDKVYDRAIPIEINERAEAFECDPQEPLHITAEHLEKLFEQAKEEHPMSDEVILLMSKLDQYLQTRFQLAFGHRILKQMYDFVPVYVACGGTELGGLDYIIARKVLKKFESMNVQFVRDEIKELIEYIEKIFGEGEMEDSINYLYKIQNFY
ncbi:MAG: hypothetical protein PUB75_01635 [Firmicutes bacterium]|nr:hypothetical protein [Bacillota bacterium]